MLYLKEIEKFENCFVLNLYVKITNNSSSWYIVLFFHAGMLYL